jgi:hypothetical protein
VLVFHWQAGLNMLKKAIMETGYITTNILTCFMKNGKVCALDGNHRLAALKILHEECLKNPKAFKHGPPARRVPYQLIDSDKDVSHEMLACIGTREYY